MLSPTTDRPHNQYGQPPKFFQKKLKDFARPGVTLGKGHNMTTLDPATNCRPPPAVALPPGTDTRRRATSITEAVQDAVRRVEDGALRPVARPEAGLAYQPKSLLSILAYSYAWEVYGSEDIEGWMRRDVVFRKACRDEFPDARLLRKFRGHNRGSIEQCLSAALRWLSQGHRADLQVPADEDRFALEAERRVEMARFIDSIELDGD